MRAAEDDTCVLFSNRRVFLLPFPSLVIQVIEMVICAKNFKDFLPCPFSGGTKTGSKVLIRLSDLGCTTFADTVSDKELSDGKLGLALVSSSGQGRSCFASENEVNTFIFVY